LGKKVVPFKIDPEYEYRLREIAEQQGTSVSELVRKIVIDYIQGSAVTPSESTSQDATSPEIAKDLQELEELVSKFIESVKREKEKIDQHCKDHAREVVTLHPSEPIERHYKDCIKRWYGLLYNKALDHKRRYITPLISKMSSKRVNVRKYEDQINGILDELLVATGVILK
jgi:transcription termination factor NusB